MITHLRTQPNLIKFVWFVRMFVQIEGFFIKGSKLISIKIRIYAQYLCVLKLLVARRKENQVEEYHHSFRNALREPVLYILASTSEEKKSTIPI